MNEAEDWRFVNRDAEGRLVLRALCDMTADEVFDVICDYKAMVEHHQRAAEPFMTEESVSKPYPGMTVEDGRVKVKRPRGKRELLDKARKANKFYDRLCFAVVSMMPSDVDEDTPLLELLRRHWPGGQHAS